MNKKILVVDDDIAILEVIKIILEDNGYDVITTSQSNNILPFVKSNLPDAVLLDFLMPGANGTSVTQQLKKDDKTKDIPIIMVSANHDLSQTAKEADVDGFLEKPFDIEDLLSILEKHIKSN